VNIYVYEKFIKVTLKELVYKQREKKKEEEEGLGSPGGTGRYFHLDRFCEA
jgi:hypothetical protein